MSPARRSRREAAAGDGPPFGEKTVEVVLRPGRSGGPGSRLQPLRGDPDNLLLEGTNATDKASTPVCCTGGFLPSDRKADIATNYLQLRDTALSVRISLSRKPS